MTVERWAGGRSRLRSEVGAHGASTWQALGMRAPAIPYLQQARSMPSNCTASSVPEYIAPSVIGQAGAWITRAPL